MTLTQRMYILMGLLVSLGLPRVSFGISGCTNAYLMGTYNAQISSANFINVLNTVNGMTTGSTMVNPGGFGNNANSLSGQTPGIGRYYFDGNGNIVGLSQGANGSNVTIGTYTVNSDCSATMMLNSGQTFDAIIAQSGARVLFIESDSTANGATGELDQAQNACINMSGSPASFAFNFFGARSASSSSSTGTGTGASGTGGSTTAATLVQNSAIGTLSLDGNGGFVLKEWMSANGSIQPMTASGAYTIGTDCAISLTFATNSNGGTTGSTSNLPTAFNGLLGSSTSGLIAVQPDKTAGDAVTGVVVSQ